MSDIRKNLIRRAAAFYLLGDMINSARKWGVGQKITEDEHRLASIASGEARPKYGRPMEGTPVGLSDDWRKDLPTVDEIRGDVIAICKAIAEHGLDVLDDREKLRKAMRHA